MRSLPVYIDFKSPAAYLAIRPTLALAEKHNLAIHWHPFRAEVKPVPEKTADENKGTVHRRVRALARQKTHQLYANLLGLPMHFPSVPGCTDLALAVLARLPPPATDYILAGFRAYWTQQADLNSTDVVSGLCQASGLCAPDFNAALASFPEIQAQAESAGIIDTPAYLVADQLFVGREHLPWIEKLISDQSGSRR